MCVYAFAYEFSGSMDIVVVCEFSVSMDRHQLILGGHINNLVGVFGVPVH